MSMEDLLNALSDYLLQSGFQQQYSDFYDLKDAEQTLEDLRQAIADALLNSDMLDQQMREQIENMSGEQLEQLVEQLIQRMEQENYINVDQPHDPRALPQPAVKSATRNRRPALRSLIRAWTSSALRRCAISWVRWASQVLAATTRAIPRPHRS